MDVVKAVERVIEVGEELVPPPEGSGEKALRRWRVWISLAACVNAFGLAVHVALACGLAAPFYPGFVSANELTTVQSNIQSVVEEMKQRRIGDLEANILDAKKKACQAAIPVRSLYIAALVKMLTEYHKLTGEYFPEIDCANF